MSKRVFLLGAGASAASDYKLPTMKNLINEGLFRRYNKLTEFVEQYYPKTKFEEIDIEELLTFIELVGSNFSFFGNMPNPDLWHVKNELYICLQERLQLEDGRAVCSKYSKLFAGHVDPKFRETIITLNYDLVVDRVLTSLARKTQHGELAQESLLWKTYTMIQGTVWMGGAPFSVKQEFGYYLKLHGSLDWYHCSNKNCSHHNLFFSSRQAEFWEKINENSLCQLCGSRAALAIMPPNINKSLQKFPKLGLLWNLAYKEIDLADPLTIIGVSFRDADYYLKWLVKSACRTTQRSNRRIEVVDIDEGVERKVHELTGVKPTYFKSLDEYLDFVDGQK